MKRQIDAQDQFQSTLPHGERRDKFGTPSPSGKFQSTLPHGERPLMSGFGVAASSNFNPRSRMGSDPSLSLGRSSPCLFQSTLPHGERQTRYSVLYSYWTYFNPCSRMGSDQAVRRSLRQERISIHAPAWGATRLSSRGPHGDGDFNPRSRMGSDIQPVGNLLLGAWYFNPRSRMGSDTRFRLRWCR